MHDRRKVLVVDPDSDARKWLQTVLRPFADVLAVADRREALAVLDSESHIDIVTMEMTLPDQSSRKLLRRLRRRFPDTAVIVITHVASLRTAVQAVRAGAVRYFLKPFDVAELVGCLEEALAQRELVGV